MLLNSLNKQGFTECQLCTKLQTRSAEMGMGRVGERRVQDMVSDLQGVTQKTKRKQKTHRKIKTTNISI